MIDALARAYVICASCASAALALALLGISTNSLARDGSRGLLDPRAATLLTSACVVVTCALGGAGAYRRDKGLLLTYIFLLLAAVLLLVYLCIVCYLGAAAYVGLAADMAGALARLSGWSAAPAESAARFLRRAGDLAAAAAALLLVALGAAHALVERVWLLTRSAYALDALTLSFGAALTSIGVYTKEYAQTPGSVFAVVVGALTVAVAPCGVAALALRSRWGVRAHAWALSVLVALLLCVTSVCVTAGTVAAAATPTPCALAAAYLAVPAPAPAPDANATAVVASACAREMARARSADTHLLLLGSFAALVGVVLTAAALECGACLAHFDAVCKKDDEEHLRE